MLTSLDGLALHLKTPLSPGLWPPPPFVVAVIQYDIVIHLILTNGVSESMCVQVAPCLPLDKFGCLELAA